MINVLIVGAGGREHAFAWKIGQSAKCGELFVAPGNAGTAAIAQNVDISPEDFAAIADFCRRHSVNMLIVGPEAPLVAGITDYFGADPSLRDITVIGPNKAGAILEGSKDWSKQFMQKYHIPTAASKTFSKQNAAEGLAYLEQLAPPYVLKADGLAAGKGVIITEQLAEAKEALNKMLEGQFGEASEQVLIEAFMQGIELSVFALTDGQNYCLLPSAKDYKRIGQGDTGPNTGGMGAVSPVPFADAEFMEKVETQIVRPTIDGLLKEGISYKGFIFFGLMNVGGQPKVIEYNCRMGDPETEAVLPRLNNDLLELLHLAGQGRLNEAIIDISTETAATVVMVSEGYPGRYPKGKPITGLENLPNNAVAFHAGTTQASGQILTSGGRVLAFTGIGKDLPSALETAYNAAKQVVFEGAYLRKDIGFDLA